MVWVFPDRESTRAQAMWHPFFWDLYAEVAAELGLHWSRHAPDAITVDGLDAGKPRVFVDEEEVTPDDTLFITALYSLPYQSMDILNQYSVYAVLEQLGFYLPFPPRLSPIANDKGATMLYFADSPVPPIPTIRIGTGPRRQQAPLRGRARRTDLSGDRQAGRLVRRRRRQHRAQLRGHPRPGQPGPGRRHHAGGPALPRRRHDRLPRLRHRRRAVRRACGAPRSPARRSPTPAAAATWRSRAIPPELAEATAYFAEQAARVPFFCVDFLYDGERFWFSELEPDGVIAPDCRDPDRTLQRDITRARWTAYRNAHARFLEHSLEALPMTDFSLTPRRRPSRACTSPSATSSG